MKHLAKPILGYARLRSLHFLLQKQVLESLASLFDSSVKPAILEDRHLLFRLQKDIDDLLKRDIENIRRGIYPVSVLRPELPIRHGLRFAKIIGDGFSLADRKKKGRTTVFSRKAKDYLAELPKYYRRNFHFQTDGYLSEHSAELYDHQVDILFAGATDAMRRLIVPPLKSAFPGSDGRGLKFLDLGAGTGRATRFVQTAFPKAKIVAMDLSHAYLEKAKRTLGQYPRIDFIQGDASALPFKDNEFDAVFSIFLFHELPQETREKVLREARRVLKPKGFFGFVDSVQLHDREDLEAVLRRFPRDFHEPFYRNYLEVPMEGLMTRNGYDEVNCDIGFLSKVCWA